MQVGPEIHIRKTDRFAMKQTIQTSFGGILDRVIVMHEDPDLTGVSGQHQIPARLVSIKRKVLRHIPLVHIEWQSAAAMIDETRDRRAESGPEPRGNVINVSIQPIRENVAKPIERQIRK